jgi:predicted membrane protein
MDRWGDRFGERMDRWGERFGERMDRRGPGYRSLSPNRHLFSGVVFVAIGVLFLLGNMGVLEVDRILRFWPVLLIAGGAFKLIECRDDYRRGSGIFWIVIGSLLLLGSLGILRVSLRDFWPLVLIGFGTLMLWRYMLGGGRPTRYPANPPNPPSPGTGASGFQDAGPATAGADQRQSTRASSNSTISATAILGGVERRNNSQDFRGGSATAFMGHCEIDLRTASIASPNEAVLEVFAMWGGIEVRVPSDWTVVSQVDPIMGGYEDATQPPKEESKRFVIRGPVIMGGIEVTN